MPKPTDPQQQAGDIGELVARLREIQRACAGEAPDSRREKLARALDAELAPLSPDMAEDRREALRTYLATWDPEAARRLQGLEADNQRLRRELDDARRERDRLLHAQTAVGGAPAAPGGAGGTEVLQGFRQGLLKVADERKVTPEEAGVPPAEAQLFVMVRELLRFALELEIRLQSFLRVSEVGEVGMMATRVFAEHEQIIRRRFKACLQNEAGAIPPLREVLDRNLRFLVDLHRAYDRCISAGTQALLAELSPDGILEASKGMLGANYQEAWKKLSRLHAELAAMEKGEMWERFFEAPFRKQLAAALPEPPAGKQS